MLIAMLSTLARICIQLRYLIANEGIKKLLYICTTECYIATRKGEIMQLIET